MTLQDHATVQKAKNGREMRPRDKIFVKITLDFKIV